MNHEQRTFKVDIEGVAEEADSSRNAPLGDVPRGTRVVANGVPLGIGESLIASQGGHQFYFRPTERRAYDVEAQTWIDIPDGVDPSEFLRNQ